ncbi:peroxiredoxin, OsmC-like protein [Desulfosarcina variabilis str. Montpellier]|uniref:OsmC family protein n=1 Tax=Desulfosarcina variabilis TaxID=2300 RepID=UPI003AFA3FC6
MKTKVIAIAMSAAFFISGGGAYAQTDATQSSKVYQVETRLDDYTRPTTFTATKAKPANGAITENIVTTTQNILNKEAVFLKKGLVKPVGEDQFSAWELVSDEGGSTHHQTAPNPLTYYAAGASSSLLTQVERMIQILDLDVEDVKVESKIFFRWSDPMTGKWSGYTDKVISNILIKSSEPPDKIKELKEKALKAWAVGEGLANKTTIDVGILINADDWAGLEARPGKVESAISIDNGRTITNVTPDLDLQTVEIEEDYALDMHKFPNPFTFSEISIAESAHDASRPYLHKIRAKSLTENYETWELYADDSRGYEGIDKAPTSRDYFTVGTSFCLMSQLTANRMYAQKQGINIDDFRVEHQFNYQQDNFMTPTMTGHLDYVITRVIVKSGAAKEALTDYAKQALRMCFAGEGVQNETEMETGLYLNGKIVK